MEGGGEGVTTYEEEGEEDPRGPYIGFLPVVPYRCGDIVSEEHEGGDGPLERETPERISGGL